MVKCLSLYIKSLKFAANHMSFTFSLVTRLATRDSVYFRYKSSTLRLHLFQPLIVHEIGFRLICGLKAI